MTDQAADLIWTQNDAAFKKLQSALADMELSKAVESALTESIQGLTHSFLCILDGATKMSEKRRIYLVDDSGDKVGEGLHEEFQEFLYERG